MKIYYLTCSQKHVSIGCRKLTKNRKRMTPVSFPQPNKLKAEDSVMIKDHTADPFDPV